MFRRYEAMDIAQLKAEVINLEQELEDLEDDREIVLGQQGQHINASSVTARFEEIANDLDEKLRKVKQLIGEK